MTLGLCWSCAVEVALFIKDSRAQRHSRRVVGENCSSRETQFSLMAPQPGQLHLPAG